MTRILTFVSMAAAVLFQGCACTPHEDSPASPIELTLPRAVTSAVAEITEPTLSEVVAQLADDALAGRGPASEGDRATQQFIADTLQRAGFSPGGPGGSWLQPIELVGITPNMPETWSFRTESGEVELAFWDEYVGVSGPQQEQVAIDESEVVFVGYGITAPEEDWDDFKGADLEGKVLLMLNNDPDWDPELFAGRRRLFYGRWTYKYESAARQRAAAAVIIHTEPSAGYPFQVVQAGWTGEQFELPAGGAERAGFEGWVSESAARRIATLGGHDLDELIASARSRDFRPVPLGLSTSIRFNSTIDRSTESANVLGLLPGSDPELRDEVVVYTAHHDHLGVGEPDQAGDTIYNGARDNASGVATVLGVARAFAALDPAPRRSILILLVAAEEQGLLGSRYYAAHPTVHPGNIAANINVDSPNIFGRTRDVAVIGRGKSSLEDVLESAAALQQRVVVDEPFPDKGYYYRSDQFNFAKIGVPALYFKAGTEFLGRPVEWGRQVEDDWRATRYHRPGDEVYEDWDFSGMVEDTRLAFLVGLLVANADALPTWRPGDEFESVRRQALADAP